MERQKVSPTTPESAQITSVPSGFRPWEDRSLPAEERFSAYKGQVAKQIEALMASAEKLGDQKIPEFERSSAMQELLAHSEALRSMTVEKYCDQVERPLEICRLLGRNFLGSAQWKAQGIDVGEPPPIPASVTRELLESDCPLQPGEKIKETHLLVLIPKTVNGEAYSALKLNELCATRKGSGNKLIYDGEYQAIEWQQWAWAKAPQAQSEWVLIPKSDPDPMKVSSDKHFRDINEVEQEAVHSRHYGEYREVNAIELMTAVLLYDLTHKERLLSGLYLRCTDLDPFGCRECVGDFREKGLWVDDVGDFYTHPFIGRALARKL